MTAAHSNEKITILRATGSLVLAKTWLGNGESKAYDSPKNYTHRQEQVSGIYELSALLARQAAQPQECIIRGGYIGDEFAVPVMQNVDGWKPGHVLRQKEVFRDRALHSVMIDIDKFESTEYAQSTDAIDEFIETHLPAAFRGVTYHWQWSSSAGNGKTPGLVKAHIWFWLDTPYTSEQMAAWAKGSNLTLVDASLFREVQPHYTSDPVMGAGLIDPLAGRRWGLVRGFSDSVPLTLTSEMLRPKPVVVSVADDDAVAQILYERGMVQGERKGGGLYVECPRQEHHTDGQTNSTACLYMPGGTGGYDHGNFSCKHAGCQGVAQPAFREALGIFSRLILDGSEFTVAPPADAPAPSEAVNAERGTASPDAEMYVNAYQQIEFFAGCVYVVDQHKILVPGGHMLRPEQFKVRYGGHIFVTSADGSKSTKDAWECFTLSPLVRFPRADSSCFRPTLPAAAIVSEAGRTLINTWWPIDVPRKVGDAGPFMAHMVKLLPDERDRMILLCYMAACVQHKGVKFQWAPIVQGVEGNGKTLFTRCVAEAVGKRYVHWPKASKLANQFNSWMVGKVFYGVEDIYTPGNKAEVIEELKPMITGGDGLEIEGKGVDQISVDIVGNFLFNSNHKDAVKKTRNDRRFAPLFTAQQDVDDLKRDGMDPHGPYFQKLYDWLKLEDGYAIVSELLHTYPIPDEFNPATGCQRAPRTTSTEEAIHASIGSAEQEVLEAVDQHRGGFSGGWISSVMLERFLQERGIRMHPHKRLDMLKNLGYVKHPALPDGRALSPIAHPDNAKPRLYIKYDSEHINIKTGPEAVHKYVEDQGMSFTPGGFVAGVR